MRLETALMVDEVKEPNSKLLVAVLLIREVERLKTSDVLSLTETQV